jgi:hypothetical protein
MVFVYPLFLWAFAAISIPVIIHLFNFRRYKKVYFTNVKFLRELQLESKSRSRLRELLVLLCRCLAIACLVLAFSQPVIPGEKKALQTGAHAISLYLDNSFSMQNINTQGPLLELAKTRAREVVKAFGGADKFQVITNDFEGRHQRFYSREDALGVIDDVKISSSVRLLGDVLKRQREFLAGSGLKNKRVFVFSDAQKSTFNLAEVPSDTSVKTTLVPFKANRVNNVYIDSCWFESPLQQKGFIQKLHASIVNDGDAGIDVSSARLFLNGQQIAISSFSLEARSKNEVQFTFECKQSGFNFGSVKIEDFPITFDDELFFAFDSRVNVSVSLINGTKEEPLNSFSSLFKSDSLFRLQSFSEQTIDYNAFKTSDVIVLNQLSELSSGLLSELIKFTGKGGALVIIPAREADLVSYNQALAALKLPSLSLLDTASIKTEKIENASGFYTGVFEKMEDRLNLPLVNAHYKLLQGSRSDLSPILSLQNSDLLLGSARLNNAVVYLFTAPLNSGSTNFSKHALFVPTFYQVSFSSLKTSRLFYPVSSNVVIHVRNDAAAQEQPPHIKQKNKEQDIIPEQRIINNGLFLYTRHQVTDPGFYEVLRNSVTLMPLAFNYSRRESNLEAYTTSDLKSIIEEKGTRGFGLIEDVQSDITAQVLQDAEGKKLWKLFIILTVLFIAAEVALLRLLK